MTTKLEELKNLEALTSKKRQEVIDDIIKRLQDSSYLKKKLQELENSTEVTWVQNDNYAHSWVRFDASEVIDVENELEVEALRQALDFFYLDLENEAITSCIGPAIIVNDDGSVYDQEENKIIIEKDVDRSRAELRDLIEAYQERQGVFNWVLRSSNRGDWIDCFDMTKKEAL